MGGDQMAVHVPLSLEAQTEALLLMFSHMNLLSPAIGDPPFFFSMNIFILFIKNQECQNQQTCHEAQQVPKTKRQGTDIRKLSKHIGHISTNMDCKLSRGELNFPSASPASLVPDFANNSPPEKSGRSSHFGFPSRFAAVLNDTVLPARRSQLVASVTVPSDLLPKITVMQDMIQIVNTGSAQETRDINAHPPRGRHGVGGEPPLHSEPGDKIVLGDGGGRPDQIIPSDLLLLHSDSSPYF